jgi:hypothetical protein
MSSAESETNDQPPDLSVPAQQSEQNNEQIIQKTDDAINVDSISGSANSPTAFQALDLTNDNENPPAVTDSQLEAIDLMNKSVTDAIPENTQSPSRDELDSPSESSNREKGKYLFF